MAWKSWFKRLRRENDPSWEGRRKRGRSLHRTSDPRNTANGVKYVERDWLSASRPPRNRTQLFSTGKNKFWCPPRSAVTQKVFKQICFVQTGGQHFISLLFYYICLSSCLSRHLLCQMKQWWKKEKKINLNNKSVWAPVQRQRTKQNKYDKNLFRADMGTGTNNTFSSYRIRSAFIWSLCYKMNGSWHFPSPFSSVLVSADCFVSGYTLHYVHYPPANFAVQPWVLIHGKALTDKMRKKKKRIKASTLWCK